MQLFVLCPNSDPAQQALAAREHFDSHVVKIPLEVAQLLSILLHVLLPEQADDWHAAGSIYKYAKSYAKHPCMLWMLESRDNVDWACAYGLALCEEYWLRYGKEHKKGPRRHSCEAVIKFVQQNVPNSMPRLGRTEFAQAIPENLRVTGNAVEAYRAYYQSVDKAHLRKWKHNSPPAWFSDPVCVPKSPQKRTRDANAVDDISPKRARM